MARGLAHFAGHARCDVGRLYYIHKTPIITIPETPYIEYRTLLTHNIYFPILLTNPLIVQKFQRKKVN